MFDLLDQIFDILECPSPDGLLGYQVEPDLDLVKPRGVSRRVMNLIAGVCCQPAFHLGVLMRRIIVHYQMDIQVFGNVGIHLLEELEVFLVSVVGFALGENLSASNVEGRKEGGGPVADIIVGDSFHVTQPHQKNRLGTIQRLNLAFFVDAQNDGLIRGV